MQMINNRYRIIKILFLSCMPKYDQNIKTIPEFYN